MRGDDRRGKWKGEERIKIKERKIKKRGKLRGKKEYKMRWGKNRIEN